MSFFRFGSARRSPTILPHTLSVPEVVLRLRSHDPTFTLIDLNSRPCRDSELAELVDCLLAHPDVVKDVLMANTRLTDETGVKLARYLAASSTVQVLGLAYNSQLGEATYLALAAALRVNTSLQRLYLFDSQPVDSRRVDAAFVDALRLNPDRPADSIWLLYTYSNDNPRLKEAAQQLGHPPLQMLLSRLFDD